MPLFVAALLGALVSGAGSIVGRVLISLGIGYVTYTGLSLLAGAIKTQVVGLLGSAPGQMIAVMSLLKIDVAVSILFSALAARWVLAGLTSGALTRMIVK